MKKFLSLFLTLFILFSFAACGESENNMPENNSSSSSNDGDMENNKDVDDNGEITVDKVKNAPETSADDFTTQLVDGGIMISRYTGEEEIVVIPETIDGLPVVKIGTGSFVNITNLKGIRLSDTVKEIGNSSFIGNSMLEIFICGNAVKKFGQYAVNSCESLEYIELNYGLEVLDLLSLAGNNNLKTVYIPETVSELNRPFIGNENEKLTIITESGSAAETYAKENGIKYEIR